MYAILQHITRQSEPKQPQAFTLANPFIIPMHREKQRSKKSVVKDSVCISAIRELFFDLRSVAAGSQDELFRTYP